MGSTRCKMLGTVHPSMSWQSWTKSCRWKNLYLHLFSVLSCRFIWEFRDRKRNTYYTQQQNETTSVHFRFNMIFQSIILVGAFACASFIGIAMWQIGDFHGIADSHSSPIPPWSKDSTIQRCNGLASNCGWRVNEIMFPAVHNAMSSRNNGFLGWNNLLSLEVRSSRFSSDLFEGLSILNSPCYLGQDALESGYRALFIDSCDCPLFTLRWNSYWENIGKRG